MAKRKVKSITKLMVVVNIYWDNEWEEYTCVLTVDGKKNENATYHTSDKEDAMSSAADMLFREAARVERLIANNIVD